jgi:hypothetical protein
MPLRAVLNRAGRWFAVAGLIAVAGCGTTVLTAPLPNAPGLDLEQLRDIQRDPTLNNNEKLAVIRAAINVPDTPGGNRIATFLLNLFIP